MVYNGDMNTPTSVSIEVAYVKNFVFREVEGYLRHIDKRYMDFLGYEEGSRLKVFHQMDAYANFKAATTLIGFAYVATHALTVQEYGELTQRLNDSYFGRFRGEKKTALLSENLSETV